MFYAITGETEFSAQYAQKGIDIGKILQSIFVQSVGYMRLGHVIQLQSQNPFHSDGFKKALEYYQESIDKIDITRIHVEPIWGICRALGYSQRIREAEIQAREGLNIAKRAGDEWISILIQLSLGSGQVLNQDHENAHKSLTTAEEASYKVQDPFVLYVSRLWLAILAWNQGFQNTAFGYLEKLLPSVKEHGYHFLLTRQTFLGLKDTEVIFPLLLAARQNGIETEWIGDFLLERGLDNSAYHPGYTLYVRTFGSFRVWRGDELISPDEWKRQKARQVFKLLVANRERWLHRDQIITMLWSDSLADSAATYLKVVINALNQVLEPNRSKGATPFFIERDQNRYRLNPRAKIIIDAEMFIQIIHDDSPASLEKALQLYEGHYFAGSYVQEWLTVDEQYYHQQFLLSATKLAQQYYHAEQYDNALEVTYKIIGQDCLYEMAYQLQMQIFHKMKRYSMVRTVFKACQNIFRDELNIQVSTNIIELFDHIMEEESQQFQN